MVARWAPHASCDMPAMDYVANAEWQGPIPGTLGRIALVVIAAVQILWSCASQSGSIIAMRSLPIWPQPGFFGLMFIKAPQSR